MEKHGFCHAFLFAKTLLLQKHHVRNSRCSLFAFFPLILLFCRCESNQLHSSTLNVVVDCDVALRGGDVAMSSQASKYKHTHPLCSE